MMKKMRIQLIVICLLLMSSTVVLAHTGSLTGYSWSEGNGWSIDENHHTNGSTVTYSISSNMNMTYKSYVYAGDSKWTEVSMVESSSGTGYIHTYDDPNTSATASFYNYNSDSSGHLTSWKIRMNEDKMDNRSGTDNGITMAHEFGHAIGLNDLYASTNINKLMYGTTAKTATAPTTSDNNGARVITGQHTSHSLVYIGAGMYQCSDCKIIKD